MRATLPDDGGCAPLSGNLTIAEVRSCALAPSDSLRSYRACALTHAQFPLRQASDALGENSGPA